MLQKSFPMQPSGRSVSLPVPQCQKPSFGEIPETWKMTTIPPYYTWKMTTIPPWIRRHASTHGYYEIYSIYLAKLLLCFFHCLYNLAKGICICIKGKYLLLVKLFNYSLHLC